MHGSRAALPVTVGPPASRGSRDPEPICGPPQRPGVIDDTASQEQTTARGQDSVSVGHEDLREVVSMPLQLHTSLGVLLMSRTPRPVSTCHQRPWSVHLGNATRESF